MINRFLIAGLITVLNSLFIINANSQSLVDAELKVLYDPADTAHHDYTKPLRVSENEIDATISTVFIFYKTFLSSQDMPSCIFTPSCSEYALEAFQKKGLFMGWLSTFDRLSRCHGFVKPNYYPFDNKINRFYDPVW